ncbi:MAG TPA: hypothetical protein VIV57_11160 [Anaeromyxobacter sp.]
MTAYDSSSFSAGQDSGTRLAACVARLAALELIDNSRWWNHWRHRLMARALVACAEEMECAADTGESRQGALLVHLPKKPEEEPRSVQGQVS